MASPEGIAEAWAALRGSVRSPWKSPAEIASAESVWLEVLDEVPDALLAEAVRAHLERSKWWPSIAELLALVPRRQAQVLQLVERSAFIDLEDGALRVRLMDQAVREVAADPPCRSDRCSVECRPCRDATLERVEALAKGLQVGAA